MLLAHDAHWWWPLLWLVWLAAIGTVVWFIFRRRAGRSDGRNGAKSILAERFARGEIDADEYRERLAQLG
jgi:putative membrane protein